MALLRLKRLYAAGGLEQADDELPDYLPLMLEFAALAPPGHGETLLREHRPALELLRHGLQRRGSPTPHLLDALVRQPAATRPVEREHARRLAADGPPDEQVGLEPFAPPEVHARGMRAMSHRASLFSGSSCRTCRSTIFIVGHSGATAATSSAGRAARPSCSRAACSPGAARSSTTAPSP